MPNGQWPEEFELILRRARQGLRGFRPGRIGPIFDLFERVVGWAVSLGCDSGRVFPFYRLGISRDGDQFKTDPRFACSTPSFRCCFVGIVSGSLSGKEIFLST